MEDSTKDLKKGEGSPSDADQSEKKPAGSIEASEGIQNGASDEKVTISKSELEQFQKDSQERKNLRKAVIRLNRERGRVLPGSEPVKEKDEDVFGSDSEEEKFVTKKELIKRDEKSAINEFCKKEENALYWSEIIVFYTPPKEKSYEAILAALNKSRRLWKADKGITPKEDEGKKATQDLASEKGLNTGKEKKPTTPRKSILPRRQNMENWYDKK